MSRVRLRPLPRLLLAAACCALPGAGPAGAAEVYWDTKSVLRDFFQRSEKVSYLSLDTQANAGLLRQRLGYLPPKPKYTVFVAKSGDQVDGYAVIDDELGQHEPITFAVQLDPQGKVLRTEVMVYREAYGGEIREDRFRKQFNGRAMGDAVRVGEDVVAISGATISSRSLAAGVRRALALVALARAQETAHAQARAP